MNEREQLARELAEQPFGRDVDHSFWLALVDFVLADRRAVASDLCDALAGALDTLSTLGVAYQPGEIALAKAQNALLAPKEAPPGAKP